MTMSAVPAVLVGDRPMDWLDEAACRGCDPELFFPVTDIRVARAQVEAARRVCRCCLVKGTCLGGTTEEERRQLYRRRRTPA
jgi:WhiB family transcriptional regulator, redox-sensing transcriptional regulator